MSGMEQFDEMARGNARLCGLSDIEISEAAGAVTETTAIRALQGATGSALLLGPPGTGKTLAAIRWALVPVYDISEWFESVGVGWVRRPMARPVSLFKTAKSLSRVQQYDDKAVEPLFGTKRVVIDDLGQEYLDKSGFLVALIDEIVSERHRRRLPTVMTANVTAEEFEKRYGQRVVDRIASAGKLVICDGQSLRRRTQVECSVLPLVTPEMLVERLTVLTAQAANNAARHRARLDAQEREWMTARSRQAESLVDIKSPPRVTMTDAELEARKTQIARDLADWRARNPEPTT